MKTTLIILGIIFVSFLFSLLIGKFISVGSGSKNIDNE